MSRPTDRQLVFIAAIEEFVDEEFLGTTKEDAAEYIDRNVEEYRLASCDAYQLEHGYF